MNQSGMHFFHNIHFPGVSGRENIFIMKNKKKYWYELNKNIYIIREKNLSFFLLQINGCVGYMYSYITKNPGL